MIRHLAVLSALAATTVTAAPALAGSAQPPQWTITVTATGPGSVSGGDISSLRDGTLPSTTLLRQITLTPTQDGNNAEFRGWLGACAPAGVGPCTVDLVREDSGLCLWTAAVFAFPGEPTPAPRDPCAPAGGGSGTPGTGGGTGAGGSSGGSSPGGSGAAVLPGGATAVATAPGLRGTRVRTNGRTVRTTGGYPASTSRVVQSLVRVGRTGVTMAGRCRMTPSARSFTCTARPTAGRWRVITQARRGTSVVGQSTTTITVR